MDKPTHVLGVIALTVVIMVGVVYMSRTVTVECFNWWGLSKGCAVSTVK